MWPWEFEPELRNLLYIQAVISATAVIYYVFYVIRARRKKRQEKEETNTYEQG